MKWFAMFAALTLLATPTYAHGEFSEEEAKLVEAIAALTEPAPPQFGACWENGWCIGPRVAAPAMAIDLKTGDVEFNVIPGFGYGFEKRGTRIQWGISAFINTRETANGRRAMPSVMLDFMRYVHTGPAYQFGDERLFWMLTLGTDLGSAPPNVVAKPE